MNEINPTKEVSRVYCLSGLVNKKKLFEKLAELLSSASGISFQRVLDSLNGREKMGSTYIGKGVAIPHSKLSIASPIAAILILDEAIKYAEDSDKTVDIVFGLLVPADNCEQHIHILSSIASLCEQDNWLQALRELTSEQDIVNYLSDTETNLVEIL